MKNLLFLNLVLVRYYAIGSTQAVRRGRQYQFTAQKKKWTLFIIPSSGQKIQIFFLNFIFFFFHFTLAKLLDINA